MVQALPNQIKNQSFNVNSINNEMNNNTISQERLKINALDRAIVFNKYFEESLTSASALANGYMMDQKGRIAVLTALGARSLGLGGDKDSFFDAAQNTGMFVTHSYNIAKEFIKLVSDKQLAKKVLKLDSILNEVKKSAVNDSRINKLDRILVLYKRLVVYQKAQIATTILFHATTLLATTIYFLSDAAKKNEHLSLKLHRTGSFLTIVGAAEFASHHVIKKNQLTVRKYAEQGDEAKELNQLCKEILDGRLTLLRKFYVPQGVDQ